MAEPRCPSCDAVGIDTIVSKPSKERSRAGEPWFFVVHCDDCGHVYDIVAKHVMAQRTTPRFVLPKQH